MDHREVLLRYQTWDNKWGSQSSGEVLTSVSFVFPFSASYSLRIGNIPEVVEVASLVDSSVVALVSKFLDVDEVASLLGAKS